jgi:hypothetical protein
MLRLLFAVFCFSLASGAASGQMHGLKFGPEKRLEILPVLFVPSDNMSITPQEIQKASKLAYAHLEVAQRLYKKWLGTDTFKIADGELIVFRSPHPHSHYVPVNKGEAMEAWQKANGPRINPDTLALREVLEWRADNRFTSKYIYVIIYARPPQEPPPHGQVPGMATGGAFNGAPGSGGGAAIVELAEHVYEAPGINFSGMISHELGHAFGLAHVDCYGYDQSTDHGAMSYNGALPLDAVILNPEDYFVLSRNKPVFPNFKYDERIHNPQRKPLDRIESCYFYPHDDYLGPIRSLPQQPGVRFEIFSNGQRVSTKFDEFIAFKPAKAGGQYLGCRQLTATGGMHAGGECRYNGKRFDPGPEPKRPDLAGAWAARCSEPRQTFLTVKQDANGALTLSRPGAPDAHGQLLTNDFEVYTLITTTDAGQAFISTDGKRLTWNNGDGVWWRCAAGTMKSGAPFTAQVRIRHDGKCMDARRGAMGDDEVWQWECSGTAGRRWQFIQDADGYYTIKAQHSGRCLSIFEADTTQSGMAFQIECKSTDWQKFKLIPDNDGFYRFVAKHSNLCLGVLMGELFDGQIIHQAACLDYQYNFKLQM